MERAVLLHSGPIVKAQDLGLASRKSVASIVVAPEGRAEIDFASGGIVLDEVERELITKALETSGWNRTQAAQLLGISKDTLRYRMERYQLQSPK